MLIRLFVVFGLVSFFFPAPVAAQTFEGLTIEAESNDPPYDRDLYKHWIDADEDDEDTRQEMLIQESLIPLDES